MSPDIDSDMARITVKINGNSKNYWTVRNLFGEDIKMDPSLYVTIHTQKNELLMNERFTHKRDNFKTFKRQNTRMPLWSHGKEFLLKDTSNTWQEK